MSLRLRRQPPVRSPIPTAALLAPLRTHDPRPALAERLRVAFEVQRVVLTDSGTSALALAMRAAVTRRDGICLLPGYGCYDLASAAMAAGVRVALYDLDPRTLLPDHASLGRLLDAGASSVVVVHPFGIPVPAAGIIEDCVAADAVLIDDAAQAAGARLGSRRAGALGDVGVLSFGRGKGVTGGGGGALLVRHSGESWTNDRDALGESESRPWRATATLLAQWALARPVLYGIPSRLPWLKLGETIFRAPSAPLAMSQASARILERTLGTMDVEAATRRATAARLSAAAQGSGIDMSVEPDRLATGGWLRFPVVLPPGIGAPPPAVRALGVVRGYPVALASLAQLQPSLASRAALPGSEELARRLWTLPTHGGLSERDISTLETWLTGVRGATR